MDFTLHNGDCLEVMKSLPNSSVDAIATDPPWMAYKTGRYDASEWHRPIEYVPATVYAHELFRVLRPHSAALLWCRWDCFESHAQAMREAGFTVRNCIIWAKPNHTAGDLEGNVGNKHESAVFAVKGNWKRHDKRDTNLWEESHLFSRDKRHHPTEKPVNLMRRSVRLVCPEGQTVLDPFMGSGSTGVAALLENRKFIGIEKDPQYFAIAKKRIEETLAREPLFV